MPPVSENNESIAGNGMARPWQAFERLVFLLALAWTGYALVWGLAQYLWRTARGAGLVDDLLRPLREGTPHQSVLALIAALISFYTVWEIARLVLQLWRRHRKGAAGRLDWRAAAREFAVEYQATFLVGLLAEFLPTLIVLDVFFAWLPAFRHLSLFTVDDTWYGWLYALVCWELSTWVWHFGAHRIRLFWCLHAPHHAPVRMNMSVAWVHFFAEGYVTTPIQLIVLMALGVRPEMLLVIKTFEALWGTFIHAGERSFSRGRIGWARYFIITPSHHRVHHARNPIYMDTNFCTMLPLWDWLFGTLQPLRDDVAIEYGTTRPVDPGNFADFYCGEFRALWRDMRAASGWRDRVLLALKPPGWSPTGRHRLASALRREALKDAGCSPA
jgi:sterol desaturase/sphingolipid hydroxylase (fatty acid hydroxylase superfamily)